MSCILLRKSTFIFFKDVVIQKDILRICLHSGTQKSKIGHKELKSFISLKGLFTFMKESSHNLHFYE